VIAVARRTAAGPSPMTRSMNVPYDIVSSQGSSAEPSAGRNVFWLKRQANRSVRWRGSSGTFRNSLAKMSRCQPRVVPNAFPSQNQPMFAAASSQNHGSKLSREVPRQPELFPVCGERARAGNAGVVQSPTPPYPVAFVERLRRRCGRAEERGPGAGEGPVHEGRDRRPCAEPFILRPRGSEFAFQRNGNLGRVSVSRSLLCL
jgi:hypothetical protein